MDDVPIGRSPLISRRGREIQGSPIRKLSALAEARQAAGIRVHHLNIGQPDLPTPRAVFDAIRRFDPPTLSYAPSAGLPVALAAWSTYFRHRGIEFAEKELIVTCGGSEAIVFALSAVADPDEEVLVLEPYYTNYNGFATQANVRLVPVPLSIRSGFHLPAEAELERFVTPRTRAILFSNPCNPTGAIYSREELQRLVNLAGRHGLFLLSDEVYREFAYEAQAVSIAAFPEVRDRAILLDSCSKRFNACGARVGVLASHNEAIVQAVLKLAMARLSVATVEQLAMAPLLGDPDRYTAPLVEEFRRRRDAVYEGLKAIPGVTFYLPEGAFYIVIGLPVADAEDFSRWLIERFELERETVLLAPGPGFYGTAGRGANEVRLAFMLEVETLRRALAVLGAGLQAYRSGPSG